LTKLTQRVPLVEKEMFTILEHLSSSQFLSRVCVAQSSFSVWCFVTPLFVLRIIASDLQTLFYDNSEMKGRAFCLLLSFTWIRFSFMFIYIHILLFFIICIKNVNLVA